MSWATPEQRKIQTEAVKTAEKYDITANHNAYEVAFPYAPQNSPYRAGEDLAGLQNYNFFHAGPEAKQKVIDDLNAQITPWPAYVPTLDEMGMGPKDDWGYVAPAADEADDVSGTTELDARLADELRKIGDKVSSAKPDKNLSAYKQMATNQHPTVMNDAGTTSNRSATNDAIADNSQGPLQLSQAHQQQTSPSSPTQAQPILQHNPPVPSQTGPTPQASGNKQSSPSPRKVLFDTDTEKTLWEIRESESEKKYDIGTELGPKGAYQMRDPALKNAGMTDANGNWKGKYGVYSLKDFLNKPHAQDRAVMDFFRSLKRQLNTKVAKDSIGKSVQGIGGTFVISLDSLLIAAHRQGARKVKEYLLRLQKNGWKSDIDKMLPSEAKLQVEYKRIETKLRKLAKHKINIP